jgi:hypothetical protein
MESGKTAEQATAASMRRQYGKRNAQARIRQSGPEASAEQREGTMEAPPGARCRRRLDAQRDSAAGHVPGGRRRPGLNSALHDAVAFLDSNRLITRVIDRDEQPSMNLLKDA